MSQNNCRYQDLTIDDLYTLNVDEMPCPHCLCIFDFSVDAYYRGHGTRKDNGNYGDFFEFCKGVVCPHCSGNMAGLLQNCDNYKIDHLLTVIADKIDFLAGL